MPVLAIAHILIALFFAVHSVRTQQNMYWIIILFSFPFLGSVVYFFAVFAPSSRIERHAQRAVSNAARMLNPERELREAEDAFENTPTVQNRLRLADAQFELGRYDEAVGNYRECLNGPFASDPLLCLKVARCIVESGRPGQAVESLEKLRAQKPDYQREAVSLLLAQAYAGAGRNAEARAEFEHAASRYGSFQILAEYAIWAFGKREIQTAAALMGEIDRKTRHWSKSTRQLNRPLILRLEAACRLASNGLEQ